MNNGSNINLVIEQIRKAFPNCTIIIGGSCKADERVLELNVPPFGKISMYGNYNIHIEYHNPYNIDFQFFKIYFESRLKYENAAAYYYEDRIVIFHRIGKDNLRKDFENSMVRANNFILTANEILKFIEHNQSKKE